MDSGKDRQATHPEKEREEIEGAPNYTQEIFSVQKFMRTYPLPVLAITAKRKVNVRLSKIFSYLKTTNRT